MTRLPTVAGDDALLTRLTTVALVVAGLLSVLLVTSQAGALTAQVVALSLVGLVLQVVAGSTLLRRPRAAFLTVHALVITGALVGASAFLTQLPTYLPLAFNLGRRSRVRGTAAVLVAAVLTLMPVYLLFPNPYSAEDHSWSGLVIAALSSSTIFMILPAVVGQWLRWQDERLTLALRLVDVERRQADESVARAVTDERARMARELHDIAAHHMTAVVIDAKAARKIARTRPHDVDEFLEEIVREASDATRSLREVVGLMGDQSGGADSAPSPTLHDVDALVEQSRRLNSRITLDGDTSRAVAPAVGLAAYRIVQESITNALRHAPGAEVVVTVRHSGHALHVAVTNGPPDPGRRSEESGHGSRLGITGMRSRATSLRGDLEAGPHRGGWRVGAWLPAEDVETPTASVTS